MKLTKLSAAGVCALMSLSGLAADSSEDVRDVWRNVEADDGGVWSAEQLLASDLQTLRGLAGRDNGYSPLFADDLSDATFPGERWSLADGVLAPAGKGDIWTQERYGNFILSLEFRCEEETNSGVFIRCADVAEWLHSAIEVQILQPEEDNARHNCGGIFDCLAPAKRAVKNAGEWNDYVIAAIGPRIIVLLNDVLVADMNLDDWTEAHMNPDGTKNKFNTAYKDMAREGHIGLQYHGQPVWFRNLRIKPL